MNFVRGGKKKEWTNLQLRRMKWERMSEDAKKGMKRPGSNKK